MKLYQLSSVALLALTALAGCGNGDAPVEVTVTQKEKTYTSGYDNPYITYLVFTAKADQVTIKSAEINRGNSCRTLSWYGNGTLRFGQSLQASNLCEPDQIKEVKVETDQGDYTFNF